MGEVQVKTIGRYVPIDGGWDHQVRDLQDSGGVPWGEEAWWEGSSAHFHRGIDHPIVFVSSYGLQRLHHAEPSLETAVLSASHLKENIDPAV